MDLFRTLRVSLYLMVGTGAFALAVAEQNLLFLISVIALGGLAYIAIDCGRVKPVRLEFAAAMAMALLLYHFLPLREDVAWESRFPAAFAHFVCSIQILLFFTSFRGHILFTYCPSTLTIVVISGIIHPGVSLLARLICFVAVTAWTLFIYSLWRSRESFQRMSHAPSPKEPAEAPPGLSERAFLQGLGLTFAISCACLLSGIVLFFSAPRPDAIVDFFTRENEARQVAFQGGRSAGGGMVTGWRDEAVNINQWSRIHQNRRPALSVRFNVPLREVVNEKNSILLRGAALARHEEGRWYPSEVIRPLERGSDGLIDLPDPSLAGFVPGGKELQQTVQNISLEQSTVFAIAPAARIKAKKIEFDAEGILRLADNQIPDRYEIWSRRPTYEEELPRNAVAEHPAADRRYTRDAGVAIERHEALHKLATDITANSRGDLGKARAIAAWLRNHGEHTLRLDELRRDGDPIYEFLLGKSPHQQRGHCCYYAASFVVLCRMNKLPARFCTGFAAAVTEEDLASDRVLFRNSDAHAWAEVYFGGFGWVPFDATPPAPDTPINAVAGVQDPFTQAGADDVAQKNFIQATWERLLGYNSNEQRKIINDIRGQVGGGMTGPAAVFSGQSSGGWIVAALAWLGAGGMIFWLTNLFLKRGRRRLSGYGSATPRNRAAVAFYNDLLQVLSRRGFVRRAGQTPREFAQYVVRRGGSSFGPVMEITHAYEFIRYGGEDISQDDFNRLQNSLDNIRDLTFVAPAAGSKN